MEKLNLTPDNINEASWKTFMCIGYGRTASSPVLAKQLAMLRDSDDYLMNRDRLLPSALDYINNGSSTSSGESAKATHYDRPTLTMPGREVYQEMAEWLDKGHAKGMFHAPRYCAMAGGVLNTINTRLEAATISYILEFAEAKVLMVDRELLAVATPGIRQVQASGKSLPIILIDDPLATTQPDIPEDLTVYRYDELLQETQITAHFGKPKGVVYHHRGSYLMALGTIAGWAIPMHPVYLYTVPLFHCNGWGHAWTMAAMAGTVICTRSIVPKQIFELIQSHRVTHFGGAPIVLNMLASSDDCPEKIAEDRIVYCMTAGAPPPAAVLGRMETMGFEVMHVYGLTETYGHILQGTPQLSWEGSDAATIAELKSRQGVRFPMTEEVEVVNPETHQPVKHDGIEMGEIVTRGNTVMLGYLKNQEETREAFREGWFWSGDLAVINPDGYIQVKDRAKDIIVSGGENISSVEIENALYKHDAVGEAAVVAMHDDKWGETPCAFIELKKGTKTTEAEIIEHCKKHLASFKKPGKNMTTTPPTPQLSISRRLRSTPFTSRVTEAGVKSYTVYNHMLLATVFRSLVEDYWHLCEHVQVWDVSCERQVEIKGPDASRLIQLMTPRDLSQAKFGMCFYVPLCDETGKILNDPIAIKHNDNHWWLSIADSDVILWAKGLATGYDLDVEVTEPDIWPLAVQGPKAEELVARVFGEEVKDIKFFRYKKLTYSGKEMLVARSGWSKQGGFEIYVNDTELGRQLWDDLFAQGKDLNVGPGCPNQIERMESSLLSCGNEVDCSNTPLECGLDKYVSLDADIESLSIDALRKQKNEKGIHQQLMGVIIHGNPEARLEDQLFQGDDVVGEIRSQVWSPRYNVHLAFAMCKLAGIEGKTDFTVDTTTGKLTAELTDLPFDFSKLGL
ncbi:Dimethylsulfonioproprionate demethylase DmdA [Nymphon striatum]|nr:Dimethylsulfonioproprionate demethylase DmdA [Nymphon striatum]